MQHVVEATLQVLLIDACGDKEGIYFVRSIHMYIPFLVSSSLSLHHVLLLLLSLEGCLSALPIIFLRRLPISKQRAILVPSAPLLCSWGSQIFPSHTEYIPGTSASPSPSPLPDSSSTARAAKANHTLHFLTACL